LIPSWVILKIFDAIRSLQKSAINSLIFI